MSIDHFSQLTTTKSRVDFIKERMKDTNDTSWLLRGVCAIHRAQTEEEKSTQETVESNGVGFNSTDASFLSSIAEQINKGWRLSEKQVLATRKAMLKYAGQLERVASSKGR